MEVCGDTRRSVQELNNITRESDHHHHQQQQQSSVAEITCLSPSTPPAEDKDTTPTPSPTDHQVFAAHLQMKLKSHLEESSSSSSSSTSTEEFYTNSSASHEEDTNNSSSNSEIFYDFDDVVTFAAADEELTSDYGTGGSNSTIVGGWGEYEE